MARVIAVSNQKGGVGKTTTTVNLGAYLAALGRRVLLIDFDPQANASSALGGNPNTIRESVYHGILGLVDPQSIIRPSVLFNYHYVPAAPHLAGILIELVNQPEREYFLRKFIHQLRHQYDYILIDLPPSLSLLTVNGLAAADEIIVPVQAEYYGLEGLGQLLNTVELIRANLGHRVNINGALLTMFDKREKLHREVAKNLRRHFPRPVFDTEIPRNIALAEAPSFGKPILLYQPGSIGALAYRRLAQEVIDQEKDIHALGSHVQRSANFGNFNYHG